MDPAIKKAKQAEAARLRYYNLTPDEKKDVNIKRAIAQKRKRQRDKELAELEALLQESNDITHDEDVVEKLNKRKRKKWADTARKRYHRKTSQERVERNLRRRIERNIIKDPKGEIIQDEKAEELKARKARKSLASRIRYHRMSLEEKKKYNRRRSEAFRQRRIQENDLLATPLTQIDDNVLERAREITLRNAKRAESARLRYQNMTPQERKAYNSKRYNSKRSNCNKSRSSGAFVDNENSIVETTLDDEIKKEEECDASLEKNPTDENDKNVDVEMVSNEIKNEEEYDDISNIHDPNQNRFSSSY